MFKRRLLNFLISTDQWLWSIITLGNAAPDETISAGCWRMEKEGKWQGKFFRKIIDKVFVYFDGPNHCERAYLAEINGSQSRRIRINDGR